jgi:hypothetical protein
MPVMKMAMAFMMCMSILGRILVLVAFLVAAPSRRLAREATIISGIL